MAQTLRVAFPRTDVMPMTDSVAAVFNAESSDARRYFEVVRVEARPPAGLGAPSGTTVVGAKVALYRTTATSGGDAVAPVKRDTGSASLPAAVTCTIAPTSVTTTGAPLRSLSDSPSLLFATGNTWQGARIYGGSLFAYQRGNQADAIRLSGDANVQRIVLREGEGLAVVQTAFGAPRSGQINLTVRNESSGATYQFRSRDIGHAGQLGGALISLFNGAGSGVVLGVHASEYPLNGESNLPGFRLAKIAGISGGSDVTPFAADTGTAVPAALVARSGGALAVLMGQENGVAADWAITHGATMSIYYQQRIGAARYQSGVAGFCGVGISSGLQVGQRAWTLFKASAGSGIVLRPGEGLALLAGRSGAIETSTMLYLDVEMDVLHYPPPSAGTFPVVGDVRQGIVYGPTNNLTGELVAGGGGGTLYLRRR